MYYECVRTASGLFWELGGSISDQDAMRIQSRVRIATENNPYPERVNRQLRGDRLNEEEAFAFYKQQVQPLCSRVLPAAKMEVVYSRFLSALRFILFGII